MHPIDERDLNSTVKQYLNAVNFALTENEDKTPYKQIIGAGQKLLGDKRIGMEVYKDDASSPHATFTIGMRDNRLELLAHGEKEADFTFKAKQSYLEDVVENEKDYVESPARLDLDWLKSRIGLD